jgi:hypothetical protein
MVAHSTGTSFGANRAIWPSAATRVAVARPDNMTSDFVLRIVAIENLCSLVSTGGSPGSLGKVFPFSCSSDRKQDTSGEEEKRKKKKINSRKGKKGKKREINSNAKWRAI